MDVVAAGGQDLRYIPALNASTGQVDSLAALIWRHVQGWPLPTPATASAA